MSRLFSIKCFTIYFIQIKNYSKLVSEQTMFCTFLWGWTRNFIPYILPVLLLKAISEQFWILLVPFNKSTLLYLSVSTRAVIGQFCGSFVTVRPANFENFFFRSPDPINLRDIINILLTSFFRFVLYVTDPRFFSRRFIWPTRLGHKRTGKKLGP